MEDKGFLKSVRDMQERLGQSPAGKLWDAMADSMASAITDIRQKVVEEPWFGRAVTPELVKEIEQPGIHGATATAPAAPEGGVHGRSEPQSTAPDPGPTPSEGHTEGQRQPERSEVYREKIEALLDPASRPGQSFAEAVAERYSWGKDFWPMQKDIANDLGKDQGPAPESGGMDR